MKKNILILLLAAITFSCSSEKQAQISGSFVGLDSKNVYLELLSTTGRQIVDSTVTNKKGDFKFKVDLATATPTFYNVKCDNASIPLIVSAKEKVAINSLGRIDKNYSVSGSVSSELIKEFNSMMQSSIKILDSLSNIYLNTLDNEDLKAKVITEYSAQYYQFKRDHVKFIVTHAGDMSAVYALYQRLPGENVLFNGDSDLVYYQTVADAIEDKYPDSPHLRVLKEEIAQTISAYELSKLISEAEEVAYPELQIPDMYGKVRTLSEVAEGKVVLVDFWTSTSRQATVLNAELKDLYTQMSPQGFEVYQVSLDTDKPTWILAVQDQKLPWVSVCNFQGLKSSFLSLYDISSLPSNILIDKQGDIVARDLYGDQLEAKVRSLLK